jgi:hypothetical protein
MRLYYYGQTASSIAKLLSAIDANRHNLSHSAVKINSSMSGSFSNQEYIPSRVCLKSAIAFNSASE